MSFNAIIDITIGLMTMYLVLGLVCTSINELIASLFKLRAVNLRKALEGLIDDARVRGTFNQHGLIAGAKIGTRDDPSYISGSTFALALLDSLTPSAPLATFADVESAARSLPEGNIRDIVLSNLAIANKDINALRLGLAKSFDRMMERVSGIYTRQIKWISLAVGIALAAGLNADSIAVANALWADKPRAQMLELAKEALAKGSDGTSQILANGTMHADEIAKNYAVVARNVEQAIGLLRPLPIGWDFSPAEPREHRIGDLLLKMLGLLLTGMALMLGAPFWFDVLSKFMNLRFTGDKPAKTTT